MPNISKKLIYGKGLKGNGVARTDSKTTKSYAAWNHMLERCYDPKSLCKRPTYMGCTVCEDWLFFPTFQKWFDENYVEGYLLSKDMLVSGNKVYSPDTCIFVPTPIHKMFNDCEKARGEYPQGVSLYKRYMKFIASICIDGKLNHLGYFDTADEAHQAYLIAKRENIIRMAHEWRDKIPSKLYDALLTKAETMLVD